MIQNAFSIALLLLMIPLFVVWVLSIPDHNPKCPYEDCDDCPFPCDLPECHRKENEM